MSAASTTRISPWRRGSMIWSKKGNAANFRCLQDKLPPYPPTPFPHASGGKGAISSINVHEKITGILDNQIHSIYAVSPRKMQAFLLFPPLVRPTGRLGERAGVRGGGLTQQPSP